jgi:hypothetical protein
MSADLASLKQRNNRLLIYTGLFIAINLIMSGLVKTGQAVHLDGQIATGNEVRKSTLVTLLIALPILGFILGSLLSLIPYKIYHIARNISIFH